MACNQSNCVSILKFSFLWLIVSLHILLWTYWPLVFIFLGLNVITFEYFFFCLFTCLSLINSICVCVLSRVWLVAAPWTIAYQAPLSMEFSRQEYWSGFSFPSPGDLPDPGMERVSQASAGMFFYQWSRLESPNVDKKDSYNSPWY